MSGLSKEEYTRRRAAWAYALYDAAKAIGKGNPLYAILGSITWGRYDGEPAMNEVKDNIVFGLGFLEGARYAALNAGRVLRLKGTNHLEGIHDRVGKRLYEMKEAEESARR